MHVPFLKNNRAYAPHIIWDVIFITLILGVAAYLRVRYIIEYNPWVDEYSTMLAAKMIAEKQAPILPSGLLYEHGLLYSYLAALSIKLLGFSEMSMRIPSLVTSLLTIPLLYIIGRTWFSRSVALMAIVPFAVMVDVVVWGGRSRMYSLLMLLVLLCVYFLFQSTRAQPALRRRYRLLSIVFWGLAMMTHFNAILLAIPLLVATFVAEYQTQSDFSWQHFLCKHLPDGLGFLTIVSLSIILKRMGQPKGAIPYEPLTTHSGLMAITDPLRVIMRAYTDIEFGWHAGLGRFIHHYTQPQWLPLMFLFGVGVALTTISLLHYGRYSGKKVKPLIFLCIIWGMSFVEMLTVVSMDRRDPKYLIMLFPLLSLVAAVSFVQLVKWGGHLLLTQTAMARLQRGYAAFLAIGTSLLLIYYAPSAIRIFTGQELGYNYTMRYVENHQEAGDVILTSLTSACALYLDECDYFATQYPAQRRMLETSDGVVVDRWAGAQYMSDVASFERLLRTMNRVWFVTDRWRLEAYYDADFRSLIFNQMTRVSENENSIVFLKDGSFNEIFPQIEMLANLDDQLELSGYDINADTFSIGELVQLNLLWKSLAEINENYTIFVHVRDTNNANVAQADFQPFDGTFPTSAWEAGETIQLPVEIQLPENLKPGTYQLVVGMYLLETMERLPILPDTSGENVIVLGTIRVG